MDTSQIQFVEENVATHPDIVAQLRDRMFLFFGGVSSYVKCKQSDGSFESLRVAINTRKKAFAEKNEFSIVAAADGGSHSLDISMRVGFCVAETLELPSLRRLATKPVCIPPVPNAASIITEQMLTRLLTLTRELMVLRSMNKYLSEEPQARLLVVDGPLNPSLQLLPTLSDTERYSALFGRYIKELIALRRKAAASKIPLVGFVKRPEAKYLARTLEASGIQVPIREDSILLSLFLEEGYACPWPPLLPPEAATKAQEELASRLGRKLSTYTYVRTRRGKNPFRIDFAPHVTSEAASSIVSWVLATATFDQGIPFAVVKVDEDVKLGRRLVAEIYEDVRRSFIHENPREFWGLLTPRWGEEAAFR